MPRGVAGRSSPASWIATCVTPRPCAAAASAAGVTSVGSRAALLHVAPEHEGTLDVVRMRDLLQHQHEPRGRHLGVGALPDANARVAAEELRRREQPGGDPHLVGPQRLGRPVVRARLPGDVSATAAAKSRRGRSARAAGHPATQTRGLGRARRSAGAPHAAAARCRVAEAERAVASTRTGRRRTRRTAGRRRMRTGSRPCSAPRAVSNESDACEVPRDAHHLEPRVGVPRARSAQSSGTAGSSRGVLARRARPVSPAEHGVPEGVGSGSPSAALRTYQGLAARARAGRRRAPGARGGAPARHAGEHGSRSAPSNAGTRSHQLAPAASPAMSGARRRSAPLPCACAQAPRL